VLHRTARTSDRKKPSIGPILRYLQLLVVRNAVPAPFTANMALLVKQKEP